MDPFIEVIITEDRDKTEVDRFDMPIFFILGGVDDDYLSFLMNISKDSLFSLIRSKSSLSIPPHELMGVYGSRSTLSTTSYPRVFPISSFLNEEWPILFDIQKPESEGTKKPNWIEKVWIIRALRRNNINDMAEKIRTEMLKEIYPKKIKNRLTINSILNLNDPTINNLAEVYNQLSFDQRKYPVIILIDDLPIILNLTLGDMLSSIALTGCTSADMLAIKTSLELLI